MGLGFHITQANSYYLCVCVSLEGDTVDFQMGQWPETCGMLRTSAVGDENGRQYDT